MLFAVIAGTRPNLIKVAPLIEALKDKKQNILFINTGQHYDYEMSKIFFSDMDIPTPDIDLGVGSGTHAQQTSAALVGLEKCFIDHQPDLVIVVGDVNSTLAAALAASKLNIPVAHVEAGLRSFDRTMPEEINRLVTDAVSQYLFTHCEDADENLLKEGKAPEEIFFVGNVMIDSLIRYLPVIQGSAVHNLLGVNKSQYMYITLHRPSNVDKKERLDDILNALEGISDIDLKMILPLHPRTRGRLEEFGLMEKAQRIGGLFMTDPLGYKDSIALIKDALLVVTDSGGVQEETTFLNVPCLTLRPNTERPVTIEVGTNILLGEDPDRIVAETKEIMGGSRKKSGIPALWDGKASERIVEVLTQQS